MGSPVRVRVCSSISSICVPVHFTFEQVGDAICIDSEDVNEVVAAIHTADDELQDREDQDGD